MDELAVQKLLALIVDLDPEARTPWAEVAAELRALAEQWSHTTSIFAFYSGCAARAEAIELAARRATAIVMCGACHRVPAEKVRGGRRLCGACASAKRRTS